MSKYISKSDFLKYQVCPSYFWLWKYKKDLVPADEEEAIRQRLEQGNEIERYARLLFPKAVLIESKGVKARAETEILVRNSTKVIFQATVLTEGNLLAMADVLERDEDSDTWTLYEVKSTNSIKKEHVYDVCFQQVAFEDAGYRIGKTKVIHLNKDYTRRSEIVPKDLLLEDDITAQVAEIIPTIRQQINDAKEVLARTDEPKTCSCRLKSKSGHCPTFHYFNPDIPEYSVFNIARIGGKNLALLIDGEIHNVEDVPDDIKLSVIQRTQVDVAKSKQPIINKTAIAELLSELVYPLYFLDYETVSTALPLYMGCCPYQQIPFQYSLHIVEQPGAEAKHYEYLSRDSETQPAQELLDGLLQQIGSEGSLIVWNKSFEAGRNREMARTNLNYADFLNDINERMFDLMDVFSKQHFVHHGFKGSNSIKAVLPVLVPEFSYKELDIQNGQIASIRWYDAVTGGVSKEVAEDTCSSLLKYCCLDTLAMVKIYEYLSAV